MRNSAGSKRPRLHRRNACETASPDSEDDQATVSLDALAVEIHEKHLAVKEATASVIRTALEAGRLLKRAKDELPHGSFMPWIAKNCGLSQSTATLYLRLAERVAAHPDLEKPIEKMTLRKALEYLQRRHEQRRDGGHMDAGALELELSDHLTEVAWLLSRVRDRAPSDAWDEWNQTISIGPPDNPTHVKVRDLADIDLKEPIFFPSNFALTEDDDEILEGEVPGDGEDELLD